MPGGPLKVVLPMLTFVPGGMGGSETYASELLRELGQRDDLELTALVSPAGSASFPGIRKIISERVAGGGGTAARLRTLVQARFPGPASGSALESADVVHYPFTVPLPPSRGSSRLVTLLDVQHLDLPEMFSRAERAYRAVAYDAPARRSARVVTISGFCRDQISDRLGIAPDRIEVAPLAVDRARLAPAPVEREEFVLYPAAAWPHKNHTRLLSAVERLRVEQPGLRLVLTGAGRNKLGALPPWAEHRGRVDAEALLDLYRRAGCLVFPSLYEGFGLPPLEAMSTGCPVTVARAGSLPEVCGDAAVYFDPTDPDDIAAGIREALKSDREQVGRGFAQVDRFSWKACADAHVRAYRAVSLS